MTRSPITAFSLGAALLLCACVCIAPSAFAQNSSSATPASPVAAKPPAPPANEPPPSVMLQPKVQTLDGVTVRPKLNPLENSDRKLHEVIDGLPEGEPKPDDSAVARFFERLRNDPNDLSPEDQKKLDAAHCQVQSITVSDSNSCGLGPDREP